VILALWGLNTALQIALWAKLVLTGLWRPYRRFTVYMVGLTVESGILSLVTHPAALYRRVWMVTRLVMLTLQLLTAIEIYSRWAESHRNIGKFGERLFLLLMALAIGLSLATVPVAGSSKGFTLLLYVGMVANGAIQFGTGAFMLMMLGFFAKFGGPVRPNLRRHAGAMTAFSLANTVGYFLFTRGVASFFASVLLQATTAAALAFWFFALKKSGEVDPHVEIDPQVAAEAEEQHRQMLEFAETVRPRRERESE
jgi:hypothetical protein